MVHLRISLYLGEQTNLVSGVMDFDDNLQICSHWTKIQRIHTVSYRTPSDILTACTHSLHLASRNGYNCDRPVAGSVGELFFSNFHD